MIRLISVILMLLLVACDRCKDVDCDFGTCEGGSCKCETGYIGDQCERQKKPKSITITQVLIENAPDGVLARKWDNDTSASTAFLPDVMLQVRFGTSQTTAFNSTEVYFDNEQTSFIFQEGMNIEIPNDFPELRFTLSDLDEQAPTAMYAIIAAGYYDPVGGFPEEFKVTNDDGVQLTMSLFYQH